MDGHGGYGVGGSDGVTRPATACAGRARAAGTARARSGLYGLLAAIFGAEPGAALLRQLREPDFAELVAGAGIALERDLRDRTAGELLEALAVEYTRLFVGPGRHIPPYASAHLGDGTLRGRSTVWLERFFEAAGFDHGPDHRGLPDHVGAELEFMRALAAREAQALDLGDEAEAARMRTIQKTFLNHHLGAWLPVFCDKVREEARSALFRDTAALATQFVRSECAEFGQADGHDAG